MKPMINTIYLATSCRLVFIFCSVVGAANATSSFSTEADSLDKRDRGQLFNTVGAAEPYKVNALEKSFSTTLAPDAAQSAESPSKPAAVKDDDALKEVLKKESSDTKSLNPSSLQ